MNLRQEYSNTSIALADRAYRADGVTGNLVIGASNVAITSIVTTSSDIITDAGQTNIANLKDFKAEVEATKEGGRGSILLLVRRDGQPRFVVLELE